LVYIFPFFKPQVALCAAARAMNTTPVRPKNGVTLRNGYKKGRKLRIIGLF
jgi:hypothetical protein